MRPAVTFFLCLLLSQPLAASQASCGWPAWEKFKQAMLSADGRVVDRSSPRSITTSEGQSYGLFFALLANDRDSFERLLRWTENNLAGGDLDRQLPAWLWGRSQDGQWQILDPNNASDADLWIAYSLLEAGRLWQQPAYERSGRNMLWRSAAQSLRSLPDFGLMLLPGDQGFAGDGQWRLNPSYLPPQLLARFALLAPVWSELAANARRLLLASAPHGYAPDWLAWRSGQGWALDPVNGGDGSYDAIRVYLWLGMLADDAAGRAELQRHFAPMSRLTTRLGHPPEHIDTTTGKHHGAGPAGFSAALLPLLAADADTAAALQAQRRRLREHPPAADAYYDNVLLLFGQGFDEGRYRFDRDGRLQPAWVETCND
jgi:endoglucanase